MRESPFYFEIKDVMTQFVSAFNSIVIKRHNKDRDTRSKIHVRYLYAPKQRVVHDLTNKARHITLPAVAVNIASISRDNERVFNKISGAYLHSEETHPNRVSELVRETGYVPVTGTELVRDVRHVPQPVPVNIEVSMSILARYQTDVEQIISNFVPYSDPYVVISWKIPEPFTPHKEREIRSEVLWNGNLSMEYPTTLNATEPYRVSCDTSFTIKTWLFRKAPTSPISNIYKITANMTPVPTITPDLDYVLPIYDEVTERTYVESVGEPLTAASHITHVDTSGKYNEVWGYNFYNTMNVYLSSVEINQLSGVNVQPFDPATHSHMDSKFPPFVGYPVDFEVMNDNVIRFVIPETLQDKASGDVIVRNAGGYSTGIQSYHHGEPVDLQ